MKESIENENIKRDFFRGNKVESIENLGIEEFTNIIRICDICGEEMLLSEATSNNHMVFICQDCGYRLKVDSK
ncbi:MAG: hypothetical protein RMJ51_02070 [Candidatus Calescibacterium sp.]|nr:hypothetical protein [Candidatus Calescibacterium sp.]MCX7971885.1 hypothetical protein [bacterium]MDW8195016.1 hypothetical protein [Candidatus Calescibacterium sp.]